MTGYTGQLVEKKLTFPQFAMLCARNFGALIMMRDDPMDAPIPEAFQPSDYYAKAVASARETIQRLTAMSLAEARAHGQQLKNESLKAAQDSAEESRKRIAIMREMLDAARSWDPPTKDHRGLKDFMIQQLESSIDWERPDINRIAEIEAKDPMEFFHEALSDAHRSIAYNTKGEAEEIERTLSRNEWIKALRNSLQPSPATTEA